MSLFYLLLATKTCMKFNADFHIHSHYSLATSKALTPEHLDLWAKIKGIKVIGTGDFIHPGWLKELQSKLYIVEEGLFNLRDEFIIKNHHLSKEVEETRFILTTEISCIYKKSGKIRKVHNIIFVPSFEIAEKIQSELIRHKFNITSDGRPIIGFDSKNLLELILHVSDKSLFVPAHIWTPWFSVLGDKSGFNSVEECFEDLSRYIYAVETGLSSDPPMNWACSILDKFVLLSNSDAHSPEKIGRNANIFNTELSYNGITEAIKTGNPEQCLGTIDLFPQEGKYHFAGHRKCNVCLDPVETIKNQSNCPVCGKKLIIGVMNRVAELSDREKILEKPNRLPFYSIIPLKEILGEILELSADSSKVEQQYISLIKKFDTEFDILLNLPESELESVGQEILAEGIRRMRQRKVIIKEGYDGEYGIIKVFNEGEKSAFSKQGMLFNITGKLSQNTVEETKLINFNIAEYKRIKALYNVSTNLNTLSEPNPEKYTSGFNKNQVDAIHYNDSHSIILAGPGTGKTTVLTNRILYLIKEKNINPESILAITFTNKAALEMKSRINQLLNENNAGLLPFICTFHAFGLTVIKEYYKQLQRMQNFTVINEPEKEEILQSISNYNKTQNKFFLGKIAEIKNQAIEEDQINDQELKNVFKSYQNYLLQINAFDLDDLIYCVLVLFNQFSSILKAFQKRFRYILVDEYQDLNNAQYQLIKLLTNKINTLCVIGDPNQAIYGFRGADVKYINRFLDDFPGAKLFMLNQSYRCSDFILKASENIISDINRFNNFILHGSQEGIKLKIIKNPTEKSEAEWIARTIEQILGGLRFYSFDSQVTEGHDETEIKSLSEIAVLARTKHQLKIIEKAFIDHVIPYHIIGENLLNDTKFVLTLTKMLQLMYNPNDISALEFLKKKKVDPAPLASVRSKDINVILPEICERYFSSEIKEHRNIFSLLQSLADYPGLSISEFINILNIGSEMDLHDAQNEYISLMTLHASKGLEFECVFIAGCEDGLIPYHLYDLQDFNSDEETRLLYVGMTRAKKYLYLSYAERRNHMGREYRLPRSHYLDQIEKNLFQTEIIKLKTPDIDYQLKLF